MASTVVLLCHGFWKNSVKNTKITTVVSRKRQPVRTVVVRSSTATPRKKRSGPTPMSRSAVRANYASQTGMGIRAAITDPLKQYMGSLCDPFPPQCEGVRVPDEYAYPVQTRHGRGRFKLVQNTAATISAAFLPNPTVGAIDLQSYYSANCIDTLASSYTSNAGVKQLVGFGSISSAYESLRVVAGGIKIRVNQPQLTRTGTLICAPFVCAKNIPGANMLSGISLDRTTGAGLSSMLGGISPDIAHSESILNLPGAFEVSLNDLSAKDLILPFRPITASSREFRAAGTSTTISSGVTYGDTASYIAGAGNADNSDVTNCSGWNGWIIFCNDFGTAANGECILSGEYVYHMEGVPVVSTTGSGSLVGDSPLPPVVDPAFYHRALKWAAEQPWYSMVDAGMTHFSIRGPGLRGTDNGYARIMNL